MGKVGFPPQLLLYSLPYKVYYKVALAYILYRKSSDPEAPIG